MARAAVEEKAEEEDKFKGVADFLEVVSKLPPALAGVVLSAAVAAKLWQRCNRLKLRPSASEDGEGESLTVRDILLGGSAFAGMFEPISEEEVFLVLKEAVDLGITHIDTAPHYGLGLSEERIGGFLRHNRMLPNSLTRKSEEVKVYTKVGRLIRPRAEVGQSIDEADVQWDNVPDSDDCIFKGIPADRVAVLDYSSKGALSSFRESEGRLGEGAIHGLRVHDCETEALLAAATATASGDSTPAKAGALAGLGDLKAQGKIKSVGIGVNDPSFALRALQTKPAGSLIDTVMIAGSWNLLDQSAHDLLLHCQKKGIEVHNAGVFASGLIMGGTTYRYAPAPRAMIEKARRWRVLCQKHDVKVATAALAFAYLPECVKKVAIGVKSVGELRESLEALKGPKGVPKELWMDAKKEGLLPKTLFFK